MTAKKINDDIKLECIKKSLDGLLQNSAKNYEMFQGKLASIEANLQNIFKFMSDINIKYSNIEHALNKDQYMTEKMKLLILPSGFCEESKPKLITIEADDD